MLSNLVVNPAGNNSRKLLPAGIVWRPGFWHA